MVRKRPTAQWQAKTGVSGGSHDNYYSYVDVGGPLAFDGRCAGARCWLTATANPSATTMRCSGRSATAFSKPICQTTPCWP